MGIDRSALRLLLLAKKENLDFSNMLTLGRLRYYADKNLSRYSRYLINHTDDYREDYSEDLYSMLGAKNIDTVDYSDYEGAKIIHDLNIPFNVEMNGKYSLVVDSGTLEHVFNFTTAIKSCMDALRVGGSFVGISPCNNMMGHGFYQFSPELYYRIFSESNGFKVKHMFLVSENEASNSKMIWYSVSDPKDVKSRIMLCNSTPMNLMVIAEKVAEKKIFSETPQQSDYETTWNVHKSIVNDERDGATSLLKHLFRKYTPHGARHSLRKIYSSINQNKTYLNGLGEVNSKHFRVFDIERHLHES